jgi:hypothetical protein
MIIIDAVKISPPFGSLYRRDLHQGFQQGIGDEKLGGPTLYFPMLFLEAGCMPGLSVAFIMPWSPAVEYSI